MKSIYISEMELSDSIKRSYDYTNVNGLKKLLTEHFQLIYTKDSAFDGYDNIQNRIDKTDAFIVIYDEGWSSSTWRMSELTYAAGLTNMPGNDKKLSKNIPVFIFQANNSYKIYDWILNNFIILPIDINKALEIVLKYIVPTSN